MKHGLRHSPEYRAWSSMKQRCYNQKSHMFIRYGGRGISICPEWKYNFSKFFNDMGQRPSSKHSIDRIKGDGNYEPSNCRWVTRSIQNINRKMPKSNTSGYRGVVLHGLCDMWQAGIRVNGRNYYLGLYWNKDDAAIAYDLAALMCFGEHAKFNFPELLNE